MKTEQNDRTPHEPTHEEVSKCAYYIWLSEGQPEGKGVEHWHQAELQLYMARVHDDALETAQSLKEPAFPARKAAAATAGVA